METYGFWITDKKQRFRTEHFFGKSAAVYSRSGLHATEKQLIAQLESMEKSPKRMLVAGNRTGVTAMLSKWRWPECEVICHAFDLHHARAIQRNLCANGFRAPITVDAGVEIFTMEEVRQPRSRNTREIPVYCTAALPDGPFDLVLMAFTHGLMTTELLFDQLEDVNLVLSDGGRCVVAAEGDHAQLFKQYKTIFGKYSPLYDRKNLSCATMAKIGELKKRRDFSAVFSASLPGCDPVELVSLPGCFCHRRPDTGGLALAEMAQGEAKPEMKLLDMGCGCGLIGCLLAKKEPTLKITFVDSHARALEAVRRNIQSLGIAGAKLVLADDGYVERGFDLFVGNPPYYSDYRIADVFLQTAFAVLHRGGVCMTVAKTAHALEERQRQNFGAVEVLQRRGYQILKSVRAGRPQMDR